MLCFTDFPRRSCGNCREGRGREGERERGREGETGGGERERGEGERGRGGERERGEGERVYPVL